MEFMKKVSFRANLPVLFFREKNEFVAYAPALDLSTSGKTLKEAQKSFGEAARIFVEECYKKGTLGQVLRELGWEKKKDSWAPPAVVSHDSRAITIPIPA